MPHHSLLRPIIAAAILPVVSLLPGDGWDGRVMAADAWLAAHGHSAALSTYTAAAKSGAYGGGIGVRVGQTLTDWGRLKEAEPELRDALARCEAEGGSALAYNLPLANCRTQANLAIGVLLARAGRPDEAIEYLTAALDAGEAGASYPLALALLRTGRTEEARATLASAAGSPRDDTVLTLALLTALEDPERGAFLLSAASRRPGDEASVLAAGLAEPAVRGTAPETALLIGRAALRSGQPEVALAAFGRALEAAPGWADALAHRALARYALGDDDGALNDAELALRSPPGHAGALHVAGLVYLRRGEGESARDSLEKALAGDPLNSTILCDLADAYALLHNYDQAQSDLNAAVRADPTSPVPLLRLARFHMSSLVNVEVGLAAADRAAALAPSSAEALLLQGWGEFLLGKTETAVSRLRRSVALDPLAAEAHYYLGLALRKMGDEVGARAALIRALDLDTDRTLERRVALALGNGG